MTISQARKLALNKLDNLNEIDILLAHCLNVSKVFLLTNLENKISDDALKVFESFVSRRKNKEPIQYIIGYVNFMNIEVLVSPAVLIPRQDTETIVILAKELIMQNNKSELNILDLCTGSGCIAISIMKDLNNLKEIKMYASDISEDALNIARLNAKNNDVNIEFISGSYFDNIPNIKFDYIISNPPYIETKTICTLESQVKNYEPVIALDGGIDGFDAYNVIINESKKLLNGYLILEVGINQANQTCLMMKENGYTNVSTKRDLNGINRAVYGKFSN